MTAILVTEIRRLNTQNKTWKPV